MGDAHAHELHCKASLLLGCSRLHLASVRERILIFSANVVQIHEVLGRLTHAFCAVKHIQTWIDESPTKTGVVQFHVSAKRLGRLAQHPGSSRHMLDTSRKHHLGIAHVKHARCVHRRGQT